MSVGSGRTVVRYPLLAVVPIAAVFITQTGLNLVLLPKIIGPANLRVPTLETARETVTALQIVTRFLGLIVLPAVAFRLGVRYGRATAS